MRVNPKLCVKLELHGSLIGWLTVCVGRADLGRKFEDYLINMLAYEYVGLLSVVLTFPVSFSITCKQSYDPSRYIGKARVPVDCKPEHLGCPSSWKAGVPEISSDPSNAFDEMVDTKFLYCHEGFTTCGYVPIDSTNGQVLGHSGVTIGAGIDLGKNAFVKDC